MSSVSYVGKTGKLYLPNGEVVYGVFERYRAAWDQLWFEYPNGGSWVSCRDLASRFVEDKDWYDKTCTCGASKAKQPGHSSWCDSRHK